MFFLALFTSSIIPMVMILGGYMMKYHRTEEINSIYGYRTSRSKRNKETWNFAHEKCGSLWMVWGSWMLGLSVIASLFLFEKDWFVLVEMGIQIVVLLASVIVVENMLKKEFGD